MNGDRIHPATLRFESPDLESAWREHDDRAALPRIRLTLALAFLLYALFGFLDLAVASSLTDRRGRDLTNPTRSAGPDSDRRGRFSTTSPR